MAGLLNLHVWVITGGLKKSKHISSPKPASYCIIDEKNLSPRHLHYLSANPEGNKAGERFCFTGYQNRKNNC